MKTVIVTGVSRGLGLTLSAALIAEGYHVVGVSRTESEAFSALPTSPGYASFEPHDLNDLEGVPDLISRITKEHGPIYGLVNNAAIGLDGLLATMHATQISEVIRTNLEAPILLAKYACRSMLRARTGRIINVSSIIATTGFSGLSVYGATKAGLVGFTRSLARELGRAQITVNCIAPGYMRTDMTAGLLPEQLDQVERRAPLGLPAPDDVAGALLYLLSDGARRTTGTTVTVDGGSTA